MERKINFTKRIDRYLDGELSGEELRWFEKELESNSDLAEELKLHREVNQVIREKDVLDLREQLDTIHATIEPEHERVLARKVLQNKYTRIAAATIAVLIAAGFLVNNLLDKPADSEKLFVKYYERPDLSVTIRSNTTINEAFQEAISLFNDERYAEALPLFEKVILMDGENMKAHIGAGISHMETDETGKAENSFKTVITHNDNLYVDQAEWYLGLCYLKVDNEAMAKVQFDKIASGDYTFKKKEAGKILKKLNR